MAVKIAPSPRQQFEDANGVPYAGGKLFTYAAGSSTKQATYTDSTGNTANTNPIVLDSAGRTPYGVWLTAGLNYKFVLSLSTDTDPPGSPIFTEDNISGTNDTTTTVSQWTASATTPTYINATQFSLPGDKTADFHVGRRLKFTVTAGTVYGVISATAYTTLTTVTVVLDSGSLDTGLSAVELSILTNTGSSLPGYIRTLSGLTAQQATDLAAVSTFAGTVLNDPDGPSMRTTIGADNAFSARAAVDQTVVASTNTKITFGTEEFDISNTFAESRFTPNQPGYYQLNYSMVGQTNAANGVVLCMLYKNGARLRDGSYATPSGAAGAFGCSTGSATVYLNGTTDYVEVYGFVDGVTIKGTSDAHTHFSGFRIG